MLENKNIINFEKYICNVPDLEEVTKVITFIFGEIIIQILAFVGILALSTIRYVLGVDLLPLYLVVIGILDIGGSYEYAKLIFNI